MREIKFRGKDIETGEWRYGCFVRYSEHSSYIFGDYVDKNEVLEVLTDTVGQFTGLLDKNGKEIYEGDIVAAWSQGYRATGDVRQRIDGLWILYPSYQSVTMWGLCPNSKGETSVEIIGNIHDNPELVKER